MIRIVLRNILLLIIFCYNAKGAVRTGKMSKIIVNINVPDKYKNKDFRMDCFPAKPIGFDNQAIVFTENAEAGVVKKVFKFSYSIFLSIKGLNNDNMVWLLEPGDNVTISYVGDNVIFSGEGKDKLELQYNIRKTKDGIQKTASGNNYNVQSLADYLNYSKALDEQLRVVVPMIDDARAKLSDSAYNIIKLQFIRDVEDERYEKFVGLRAIKEKEGLSNFDLSAIFDSTLNCKDAIWMRSMPYPLVVNIGFVKNKVLRNFYFNAADEHLINKSKRKLLYYEEGINIYRGIALEAFKARLVSRDIIQDVGFDDVSEMLLSRYYAETKDSVYKTYVKAIEVSARKLVNGMLAPDFELTKEDGTIVHLRDLRGKIVLLDLWFTGCVGCQQIAPILDSVQHRFQSDTNVVFLSVSIDRNKTKWLKSVKSEKYSSSLAVNVFTGGLADKHDIVSKYMVTSYPSLFLIDARGKIVQNPLDDPRKDKGARLAALISRQLVVLNDGPYLLDSSCIYIKGNTVIHERINNSKAAELNCESDQYKNTFPIILKDSIGIQPSIYKDVKKMLVVSDIEGNFKEFRTLLLNNGVIDKSYNWAFGNGHLVICGDVFDRGEQVTECLWLIYILEERARRSGGYVHFILGNHEIMNMNFVNSYSREKYVEVEKLLGLKYSYLYSNRTELGRWLRTKNIVEKISDFLFVHGGISPEVLNLRMPIDEINDLMRPYLDRELIASRSTDKRLSTLYSKSTSPFWYRQYYLNEEKKIMVGGSKGIDTLYKTSEEIIDKTLANFGVKLIVTGHTIIGKGDKITSHYGGKVINTDTKHAEGLSEALLIDDLIPYRVNLEGRRLPIESSILVK